MRVDSWALGYSTLILVLVLGSYSSYPYLKGIYVLSRVYSKVALQGALGTCGFWDWGWRKSRATELG